ncbi:hypothetical protein INR49_015322, partial [Caranx melampygus]
MLFILMGSVLLPLRSLYHPVAKHTDLDSPARFDVSDVTPALQMPPHRQSYPLREPTQPREREGHLFGTGALKWEHRCFHLPPFSLSAPLLARVFWKRVGGEGEGRECPLGETDRDGAMLIGSGLSAAFGGTLSYSSGTQDERTPPPNKKLK